MRLVFPGSSNFIQFEYIFINCRLRKSNSFFSSARLRKVWKLICIKFPICGPRGKKGKWRGFGRAHRTQIDVINSTRLRRWQDKLVELESDDDDDDAAALWGCKSNAFRPMEPTPKEPLEYLKSPTLASQSLTGFDTFDMVCNWHLHLEEQNAYLHSIITCMEMIYFITCLVCAERCDTSRVF